MAPKALPNALNAQFLNSKVGIYFRGGLFLWGCTSVGVYFRGGLFSIQNEVGLFFRGGFFLQPNWENRGGKNGKMGDMRVDKPRKNVDQTASSNLVLSNGRESCRQLNKKNRRAK